MKKLLRLSTALLLMMSAQLTPARAQSQGAATHLTVYDAGVAEVLEERAVELQPGLNQVEWRSLMPKAFARTLRVTAEDAEVVRVDVTYDGVEVRGQRSPVLHLFIQNRGRMGTRRVQVDYLAPDISWRGDYSLVLEPTQNGAPPTAAALDSWVSLYNNTGTDVRAGTVDLVAGEVALLTGDGAYRRDDEMTRNTAQMSSTENEAPPPPGSSAEATGLSAFSRFRLGRDVALNANAPVSRLPLFQGARLTVTQRNVFENEYGTQTLARGGFVLVPRGLEVRLVSKNPTEVPMPAGQVTIYARTAAVAQVVGQDRIPLTPPGGEFSVTQGRSSTLFGTRRVLERRQIEYKSQENNTRYKIITKIEVVLTNRGALDTEAFVREGVEPFGDNQWTIIEPSAPAERLAANTFQMKVRVPAGGKTTVTYSVETK
ncbi:MAG: hypothetical protein QOH49_4372 [Acidobacteriota bacterium]|jgi:hypothetical protein|nr:hypothetical protein [Acidobacteriota bacterium]